jgi:hypothetical protein
MVNKIAAATPAAAAKPPAQAAAKIAAVPHVVTARSTDQAEDKIAAATPAAAAKPLAEAVEGIAATAVAATEPVAPVAEKIAAVPAFPLRRVPQNASDELLAACRTTLRSVGESQRAVATGVKALALEIAGMAQASLTEAGNSATALIGARNFADAVEIQFGFARRSFAALIAGSTRLSEIGATLMSEISRPIVAPMGGAPRR